MIGLIGFQSAHADLAFLIEVSGTSFLPSTIHAGDVVSLVVDIENKGTVTPIVNLEAFLDVSDQIEPIDLNDSVDSVKAGSTKTLIFKFRVKEDTLPGYYPLFLTMNYQRGDVEESITQSQSILVPVSETEKNLDVRLEPKVINPGNQTELFFTIKNIGGTAVSNISFSWKEKNDLVLPLGSDNKRYVSVLQPNQEAKVSYIVAADPNITTGIYPLDINMAFTDVSGIRTQKSQVGLIIGGATDFEVSAEIMNTGQLSISIANIGSNNAGAVVVRIPKQEGITISGSNTAILGNLNKGDFTLANFQMRTTSLQGDTSGFGGRQGMQQNPQDSNAFEGIREARTLLLGIDYTDTTGERQSIQKQVQLTPASSDTQLSGLKKTSANEFAFASWILLVLIVGGAIAFNKFKAGNKEWKKLSKILAVIAILFLAVIFLLGSDLIAVLAVSVVSLFLLAWFFYKSQVTSLFRGGMSSLKKPKK
ncbi:MAG: hypothetical protein ABIE23_03170 [archaeon]